jgi:hypothetical protein
MAPYFVNTLLRALIRRLSAGQIAIPPGGSPRYLPAATPGELFRAFFLSEENKNCCKKMGTLW